MTKGGRDVAVDEEGGRARGKGAGAGAGGPTPPPTTILL